MKKQTKRRAGTAVLLLMAAVAAVNSKTAAREAIDPAQEAQLTTPLFIEGLIEPWEDLSIGVGVEGVVEEVFVQRGQRVRQGDKLVRLESSVEEAQYEMAVATSEMKATLEGAQVRERLSAIRAERNRQLFERGAVTREELEEALTNEELAILGVREAQDALIRAGLDVKVMSAILARRTVKSPVDGVVVERFLSPGELVNRAGSGNVVRIAQIHPLKVDVIAPLSLFREIKAGQRALVSPEEPIGGVYEATVKVVDPIVDAASGTFRIRLELPNEDFAVPSGVRCRVQFQD